MAEWVELHADSRLDIKLRIEPFMSELKVTYYVHVARAGLIGRNHATVDHIELASSDESFYVLSSLVVLLIVELLEVTDVAHCVCLVRISTQLVHH